MRVLLSYTMLATVLASEFSVVVYEGPTDCEDDQKVKVGDQLSMHYTGTIDKSSKTGTPGSKFDSSRDRGQTFDVAIGTGQVIKGWDEGIVGLCKGAKATLILPPEYGYGERGAGGAIPGGATLNFDVEVVDIGAGTPPGEMPNLFKDLDTDNDNRLTKEEVLAHFARQDSAMKELPTGLWDSEDKDKDGFISWEEFTGPKGSKDEL